MSPWPRLDSCSKCGQPLDETTRRGNQCPDCVRAYYREWSKTPKAKAKTRRAIARYRQTEHGKRRTKSANLQSDYGITIERFEEMLEAQNNSCAICSTLFTDQIRPHVDHCHDSGIVRGLLCRQCNIGIGLLRDDPLILSAAFDYLELHRSVAA